MVGSILCGTANNILQLAIYRALQGVGGGAMVPIAFTIIFDVVPPDKMGKFSGLFGAVFGLSSIIGPLVGAYITDHLNWRWVFYINVPIGLVACLLVLLFYHESRRHAKQNIDWLGAVTLIPGVVCLMFGLELGGNKYTWSSPIIIGLFLGAAVLFAAFFYIESKAKDPIISYAMFKKRLFAGSILVGLLFGAVFIVAVVYIPIYVQGVLGGSATNSGLVLLPMMLASSVSSQLGGRLANRLKYRTIMFGSGAVVLLGMYLLSTLSVDSSRWLVTIYMILIGLGIGPSFSVLGMAAMHHFDARQRGSASSTQSFVRQLGMTVGITTFGMVQRNLFSDDLKTAFGGMKEMAKAWQGSDPHAMLSPATRAHIPGPILDKLTAALASSVANTFAWTIIVAVLSLVCVFWLGNEKWKGFRQLSQAGVID